MKSKKAEITLENALGLTIAVLGIALLFAGAYMLYNRATTNQAQENAKNTIDLIQAKLQSLDKCQYTTTLTRKIEGYWYIVGWSKEDRSRPNKCYLNNCICICEAEKDLAYEVCTKEKEYNPNCMKNQLREICQTSKGFCREVDYPVEVWGTQTSIDISAFEGKKTLTQISMELDFRKREGFSWEILRDNYIAGENDELGYLLFESDSSASSISMYCLEKANGEKIPESYGSGGEFGDAGGGAEW